MAKKQKINISAKLNYKKPVKSSKKAVDDIARIRNNERNKLSRLNTKFKATTKKGEADKLRREIKAQQKTLDTLQSTVKTVRKSNTAINHIKAETKSLRLKNSAIKKQLRGLKGKKNEAKRDQLYKQYHRNANTIHSKENLINEQLYQVNKQLGFDPETIVKTVKLSRKYLEKNHADDFDEEYFADIVEQLTQAEEEAKEIEDEIAEEVAAEGGDEWITDIYPTVFWKVWQNFDKVETYSLKQYEKVIFEFGSVYSELAGTSLTLIDEKAKEAWAWANDQPPYVYAAKYITADRKKLKYVLYQE